MVIAGSDLDHYGPYHGADGDPRNGPTPEDLGLDATFTCYVCGHQEFDYEYDGSRRFCEHCSKWSCLPDNEADDE